MLDLGSSIHHSIGLASWMQWMHSWSIEVSLSSSVWGVKKPIPTEIAGRILVAHPLPSVPSVPRTTRKCPNLEMSGPRHWENVTGLVFYPWPMQLNMTLLCVQKRKTFRKTPWIWPKNVRQILAKSWSTRGKFLDTPWTHLASTSKTHHERRNGPWIWVASGNVLHSHGKSPCLGDKSAWITFQWTMFHNSEKSPDSNLCGLYYVYLKSLSTIRGFPSDHQHSLHSVHLYRAFWPNIPHVGRRIPMVTTWFNPRSLRNPHG